MFHPNGATEEYAVQSDFGTYNEWLNFYEAIVDDAPIVGTIAQSYKNTLLVMRALDSAEQCSHSPHEAKVLYLSRAAFSYAFGA